MVKKGADMLIIITRKFQVLNCEKSMAKKGADSSTMKKKRCLLVRNLKGKGAESLKKGADLFKNII